MARPQPPGHDAMPIAAWPAADRDAYAAACAPAGLFDNGGGAAGWRPASHKAAIGAYGRWLGFLLTKGLDLVSESPPDRITTERMKAYVAMLQRRCASVTVASYIGQLEMMLSACWPTHDWRWLRAAQASLQRQAEPSRHKAARVVPAAELFKLGCDLMAEAMTRPMPPGLTAGPRHPALLYRDGLMIALLALRPLRQRNFLGLELHRQLRQRGEGWDIKIPAEETKTDAPLDMPFPEMLLPALDRYLEVYRPALLALRGPLHPAHGAQPAGQHLWVSRCGTAMADGALHKALARHTVSRFGHHVNAHLFRDCAATSVADEHPEIARYAADLLGHRYLSTTETYYIAARQQVALRRCQTIISRHRKVARRKIPTVEELQA